MGTTRSRRRTGQTDDHLTDPALYINRELSWLDFNARVLALAADDTYPLVDRCRFLAIVSSNLDEFFMVRVSGHQDALEADRPSSAPDRLSRSDVLDGIAARTTALVAEQGRIWKEELAPGLVRAGLGVYSLDALDAKELKRARSTFSSQIFPVLTPLAIGPGQPFPYISGLSLNLGGTVTDPVTGEARFARVKLTPGLPRFIAVDGGFIPTEQVVRAEIDRVFPGMHVTDSVLFRVTRDADFSISDEADDLLGAVEAQLRTRRFGHVVRLEIERGAGKSTVEDLGLQLGLKPRDIYSISGLVDLTCLWQIIGNPRHDLVLPPWEPRIHPRLRSDRGSTDLFAEIRDRDLLVHHPFDDFSSSVLRFIEEAADDPNVVAIKQTIYRTNGDSPIIPALIRAAEAGKSVVCLVELQARFDEERNIRSARALEQAGVHVVYGQAGLKTHAKLSLVVRREGPRMRRYAHVGTGNYNPTTARHYTDVGLFTTDPEVTLDIHNLFNYLTGFSRWPRFKRLLVAPDDMRRRLIEQIDRVRMAHVAGTFGRIVIKLNALIDGEVIRALYRASADGVPIDLFVRGICGLRPGVAGISETIRVTSIVGRFLEHARIYAFTVGDDTRYFIGSADMMGRNLDNRVEVLAPVEDADACSQLGEILGMYGADTALAWRLGDDGSWRKLSRGSGIDVHATFMSRAATSDGEGA